MEYSSAKVRACLTKYELSSAATQEIPPLVKAEKPSAAHYFDSNAYFEERSEITSGFVTD